MHRTLWTFLCWAAVAATAGGSLNRIAIHYKYSDGDFPSVLSAIDSFTTTHKKYDRQDSAFIAKHLAVVYSANPDTREKGKYYMIRLLEADPNADLVDMYVSDEIDGIFSKVKKEYANHRREQAVRAAVRPPAWKSPWVWAGGIALAGAVGFLAYEATADGGERPEYVVP